VLKGYSENSKMRALQSGILLQTLDIANFVTAQGELKMQDRNLYDQKSGMENVGPKNAGPYYAGPNVTSRNAAPEMKDRG